MYTCPPPPHVVASLHTEFCLHHLSLPSHLPSTSRLHLLNSRRLRVARIPPPNRPHFPPNHLRLLRPRLLRLVGKHYPLPTVHLRLRFTPIRKNRSTPPLLSFLHTRARLLHLPLHLPLTSLPGSRSSRWLQFARRSSVKLPASGC